MNLNDLPGWVKAGIPIYLTIMAFAVAGFLDFIDWIREKRKKRK